MAGRCAGPGSTIISQMVIADGDTACAPRCAGLERLGAMRKPATGSPRITMSHSSPRDVPAAFPATLTIVVVQHALDTERFHPAYYRLAPLPGPGPHPVTRYKSRAHHPEGFETLEAAEPEIARLCEAFGVGRETVRLIAIPQAGPDILLE